MGAHQRQDERVRANRRGARAELWAALVLTFKGYRILVRRYKTPVGEIDLIARRGRRIAFVEVKQRASFAGCEAAVTEQTRQRVRRAAAWWMSRNASYSEFDQGFDLIFIASGGLPRHLLNAL